MTPVEDTKYGFLECYKIMISSRNIFSLLVKCGV